MIFTTVGLEPLEFSVGEEPMVEAQFKINLKATWTFTWTDHSKKDSRDGRVHGNGGVEGEWERGYGEDEEDFDENKSSLLTKLIIN